MSRRRPSRSESKSDEIDVTYEIDTPFKLGSAEINLINQDNEVEIIISHIPVPEGYHRNYRQYEDDDYVKKHTAARWILEDAARVLDRYEWTDSSSKSNRGNLNLNDVYFTCDKSNVNKAILDSKKFLVRLEENVFYHSNKFDIDLQYSPRNDLE
jgi:5'-deoxynucleotidase YfbR-like HD superfamily hydrolase